MIKSYRAVNALSGVFQDFNRSVDFTELERRIAHLYASNEDMTLKEFQDIHVERACEEYGCQPEDVTEAMRMVAKNLNYVRLYARRQRAKAPQFFMPPPGMGIRILKERLPVHGTVTGRMYSKTSNIKEIERSSDIEVTADEEYQLYQIDDGEITKLKK